VVYGAREVMPKGSLWVKSGWVDVHCLEPISTIGTDYDDREQLMRAAWDAMAECLRDEYGVTTSERPIAEPLDEQTA